MAAEEAKAPNPPVGWQSIEEKKVSKYYYLKYITRHNIEQSKCADNTSMGEYLLTYYLSDTLSR